MIGASSLQGTFLFVGLVALANQEPSSATSFGMQGHHKFVVSIREETDLAGFENALRTRIATDGYAISGGSFRLHSHIRSAVLTGSVRTCQELLDLRDVLHCEQDGIVRRL